MDETYDYVVKLLNIPIHLVARYENMFQLTAEFCKNKKHMFKTTTDWWIFVSKLFISVFQSRIDSERVHQYPVIEPPNQRSAHIPLDAPRIAPRDDIQITNLIPEIYMFHPVEVIVDSRMRDRERYPNANLFTLKIPKISNVVMIELTSAIIPQTSYNITTRNNIIVFRDATSGAWKTATISPGFYNITTLRGELKTQMEAISPAITYTIVELVDQAKIQITSDQMTLQLNVADSNILHTLGFTSLSNYSGASTYIAEDKYRFFSPTALRLYLNDYPAIIAAGDVESPFTLIPLDDEGSDYIFWSMNEHHIAIYHTYKTQSHNIDHLSIKFEADSGEHATETRGGDVELYDFNGWDVMLHFRFITLGVKSN
jgi:hypothetical protein